MAKSPSPGKDAAAANLADHRHTPGAMHDFATTQDTTQHFRIHGQVGADSFLPWIRRHARRLGLRGRILGQTPARVDVILSGPPDLLDAMALGCSLGPQEIWVDQIDRLPGNAPASDEFSSPSV